MTLIDLRTELKNSMLAKDATKTSVVRMLISAINYSAMAKKMKPEELTEGEISDVILKEVKNRRESVSDFEKNNDSARADSEKIELAILEQYAPKLMDENEITEHIKKVMSSAPTDIAIGPATGMVMKDLKGRADPALVQQLLKNYLENK